MGFYPFHDEASGGSGTPSIAQAIPCGIDKLPVQVQVSLFAVEKLNAGHDQKGIGIWQVSSPGCGADVGSFCNSYVAALLVWFCAGFQ